MLPQKLWGHFCESCKTNQGFREKSTLPKTTQQKHTSKGRQSCSPFPSIFREGGSHDRTLASTV